MKRGLVSLVGAGPGDPSLITLKGRTVLEQADVVLYDALSHPGLLEFCRPEAQLRNVGKRGGRQNPSQQWITDQLIELARRGLNVVRLKGGDPFLFARGAEEAEALAAADVPFQIVPGLSSPVTTAAYAGISLTHRDLSSSVTFITGTDRAGKDWSPDAWRRLATASETICILMGMRRIEEITRALLSGGLAGRTPAAVIQWGARPSQRVATGTLETIATLASEQDLTNPAVIVIGEVVRLRETLRWYDNRPLFGQRILVPRPEHQARQTAQAIFARGAEPVVFPVIRIVPPRDPQPLRDAVTHLSRYDWVLFTSANGVERFFAEMKRQGLDARALGAARVGAIGPKTSAAIERYGIVPDAQAREYTGEGLAEQVTAVGAKRVLLPRALVARDALPRLLQQHGAEVDVVCAYETHPAEASQAEALRGLLRSHGVDQVLFTSSSTVTSVVELLGAEASELLGLVKVASIGPITAQTAADLGVRVDVAAREYTVEGLLDAMEQRAAEGEPNA